MTVAKFIIISHPRAGAVEEKVSELLNDGYELAGPLFYTEKGLVQPMVKYTFPKNPPPPLNISHCSKCCTRGFI
jgi:hypothetical protein